MKITDRLPQDPTLRKIILELRRARKIQNQLDEQIRFADMIFSIADDEDEIQDDFEDNNNLIK